MFCLLILSVSLAIASGTLRSAQLGTIEGRNTTISQHPYQLSLQVRNRHRCGASLIKPNVALTSINCTRGAVLSEITVVAGSSFAEDDLWNRQVAGVEGMCNHPNYNLNNGDYDVGLLKLNISFELNEDVQTIELQPENKQIPNGVVGTLTGWGTLLNGEISTEILQEIILSKIALSDCTVMYAQYHDAHLTTRMDCYGFKQGEPDICSGDLGGPLVVNGKLVGIASKVMYCNAPNTPGIFTKLEVPAVRKQIDNCLDHFNQED